VPPAIRSPWVFVGIGLAAGLFSALFGVGGGVIVVPLLILLAGFQSKPATGTSLAVIGLTALFGTVAFAVLGEVDWGKAALVGAPAVAGTVLGTGLQRKVSADAVSLSFAAFIAVIAIVLVLE
jgi:uncharacterized protein